MFAVGAALILVLVIFLAVSAQNRKSQKYSTPDLIKQAFVNGEITEEERLLYLAYALGDTEKLAAQYYSKAPWSGTMIGLELYETVKSKEKMCKLSPFTQSELQRILREGATCN